MMNRETIKISFGLDAVLPNDVSNPIACTEDLISNFLQILKLIVIDAYEDCTI